MNLETIIIINMSIEISNQPDIKEIQNLYKTHTVKEIIEFFLNKIDKDDTKIQGAVRLNTELALQIAEELDKKLSNSTIDQLIQKQPLFGVPFALKDNILVEGQPLTAQSKILDGYTASYSSDVYKLLEEAGAVLVAQTNMDEFAFGSSTEFSGFGQITKNPHDLERVPGGTSGGSAAMIAAGMLPFAIGTDTGGSIRQPASFTGTIGIRPTYGTISRYGIVASTSSFDQAGPIANSLADNQLVLNILQQTSDKDQTSINKPIAEDKKKIKIGIPQEFFGDGLDPQVKEIFDTVIANNKENFEFVEVNLSMSKYSLAVYYILQTVEAAANLERFDTVRYGNTSDHPNQELFFDGRSLFGEEAKRRIMLGTYTSSAGYYDAYYNKACQVREKIRLDLQEVLEQVDALIMPASPFPAFKIGENASNPMSMYLADIMTVTHPITRVPALVIPGGTVIEREKKLPVGIQLVGAEGEENTLYRIANTISNR